MKDVPHCLQLRVQPQRGGISSVEFHSTDPTGFSALHFGHCDERWLIVHSGERRRSPVLRDSVTANGEQLARSIMKQECLRIDEGNSFFSNPALSTQRISTLARCYLGTVPHEHGKISRPPTVPWQRLAVPNRSGKRMDLLRLMPILRARGSG
jgi:hypothetical protein